MTTPHVHTDLKVATAFGLLYPLTPCCAASGKGAESPTGVVCRACYQPVDAMYGDCAVLNEPGAAEAIIRWTDAPLAEAEALVAAWRPLYGVTPEPEPEVVEAYIPRPGELGIGVGRLLTPILERGEDPAGHFSSVVWFPFSARAEAEATVADSDGRWVLRENIPF